MTPVQLAPMLAQKTNIIEESEIKTFKNGPTVNMTNKLKPYQIGILVDYLTRLFLTKDATQAFAIPLKTDLKEVKTIVSHIEPVPDIHTVREAALTLPFDQYYRTGEITDDLVQIDEADAEMILNLVANSLDLLKKCQSNTNDQIQTEIEFPNGLNDLITAADADYMTSHVLIDMKVSKYPPYLKHWYQLLIYYIVGLHSKNSAQFEALTHFAIINPRLNQLYTFPIENLNALEFTNVTHLLHY